MQPCIASGQRRQLSAYIARPSDCGRRLVTPFDFPVTRHREQAKVNSMTNNTYLGY
jgi:hypothetical protein